MSERSCSPIRSLRLSNHPEQRQVERLRAAAKLRALRAAAEVGWRDVEAGRYRDVALSDIAGYLAELGERARQVGRR